MPKKTYPEQLQELVQDYRDAGQEWPATARQMAVWAITNHKWEAHRERMISQCAQDLSMAMRQEYLSDPAGRSVRAKHAALVLRLGKRTPLWDDMRTATKEHMIGSFSYRRNLIVGDCVQLQTDADYYNSHHNPGAPIQIPLDFTLDVRERALVRGQAA